MEGGRKSFQEGLRRVHCLTCLALVIGSLIQDVPDFVSEIQKMSCAKFAALNADPEETAICDLDPLLRMKLITAPYLGSLDVYLTIRRPRLLDCTSPGCLRSPRVDRPNFLPLSVTEFALLNRLRTKTRVKKQ